MALKLLRLGGGASGVRLDLIHLLEDMLDKAVTPVIPAQGSVGASGDLAPLAHLAAVMMGAGEAHFNGQIMPGDKALATAGLTPLQLGPKEGLALINSTQFSTAFALAGLFGAWLLYTSYAADDSERVYSGHRGICKQPIKRNYLLWCTPLERAQV